MNSSNRFKESPDALIGENVTATSNWKGVFLSAQFLPELAPGEKG